MSAVQAAQLSDRLFSHLVRSLPYTGRLPLRPLNDSILRVLPGTLRIRHSRLFTWHRPQNAMPEGLGHQQPVGCAMSVCGSFLTKLGRLTPPTAPSCRLGDKLYYFERECRHKRQ